MTFQKKCKIGISRYVLFQIINVFCLKKKTYFFNSLTGLMSYHSYLEKKQAIQNAILNFIENSDNVEENYQNFITIISDQKIKEDSVELKSLFHLILKISKHHYRTQDFFPKIERILQYFSNEIKNNHSNFEIFNIFKGNKRILLYLIKNDLLKL